MIGFVAPVQLKVRTFPIPTSSSSLKTNASHATRFSLLVRFQVMPCHDNLGNSPTESLYSNSLIGFSAGRFNKSQSNNHLLLSTAGQAAKLSSFRCFSGTRHFNGYIVSFSVTRSSCSILTCPLGSF